ncbi:MAG: tetratricopeptide repeat protein, partial [Nannocystaceae bacterium]
VGLTEALVATGSPNASDAAARTRARLDAYVSEWASQRQQACRATVVEHTQSERALDMRMACLDDRLDAVASLVEALVTDPDRDVVHSAVEAAGQLPPLSGCEDVEGLAVAEPALDPAGRAMLSRLRTIEALTRTGRYAQALPLAEALQAEASAHDPWLGARAGIALASLQQETGDESAAEQTVSEAGTLAARAGDDALMADAWARLLWLVSAAPERAEELEALHTVAEAAVVRAGDDPVLAVQVGRAKARILSSTGQLDAAVELSQSLAERVERELGPEHPLLPAYLSDAGLALNDAGRIDEARQQLQRAAELDTKRLGEAHPIVAGHWHHLALVAPSLDEAVTLMRRALQLRRAAMPADSVEIGDTLANLAMMLQDQGGYEEAEAAFLEALEIQQARRGDHLHVARTMGALGALLNDTGQRDRARGYAEQALAMRERILPADHVDLVRSHQLLGSIALDDHDYEAAEQAYVRALEIGRRGLRKDHFMLAGPYYGLAQVQLANGDAAAAERSCTEALALEQEAFGPDHPRVGVHRLCIAQALQEAGELPRAVAEYDEVIALWSEGRVDPIRFAVAQVMLAGALVEAGTDHERARQLARDARGVLAEVPEAATDALREAEAILAEDQG